MAQLTIVVSEAGAGAGTATAREFRSRNLAATTSGPKKETPSANGPGKPLTEFEQRSALDHEASLNEFGDRLHLPPRSSEPMLGA